MGPAALVVPVAAASVSQPHMRSQLTASSRSMSFRQFLQHANTSVHVPKRMLPARIHRVNGNPCAVRMTARLVDIAWYLNWPVLGVIRLHGKVGIFLKSLKPSGGLSTAVVVRLVLELK